MIRIHDNRNFNYIILICSGVLIIFVNTRFGFIPTGCIINKFTGFFCAGCGMSRGIHSIIRGDIYHAIRCNILLFTAFPLSAFWLIIRFFKMKNSLSIQKYDKVVIISFIIFVILFTIFRNIPSPHFIFLRPY